MGALTWRKSGVYVLLALPVLGLAGIAVAAKHQDASQQSADPVADAARKAREQKKSEAKPKKVFTNDDVAPAPPAAAASTASTSTDERKDGNAATRTQQRVAMRRCGRKERQARGLDNSEAGWRKRFAEQRAKISQAEQELDILQRESTKLQTQYYTDPQKALAEQYTRKDVTDQDAKIQAKKDEIAKLKQGLSDMEDQLRAAAATPAGPANFPPDNFSIAMRLRRSRVQPTATKTGKINLQCREIVALLCEQARTKTAGKMPALPTSLFWRKRRRDWLLFEADGA